MTTQDEIAVPTVVLGKGSSTLIDLRLASPELRILLTGPRMLYEGLRMLTSLQMLDGAHSQTLHDLAGELSLEARCGEHGHLRVPIEVKPRRTGAVIEFGVGPMSMYQTELRLRTTSRRYLRDVIHDCLVAGDRDDYLVGLEPLPASGDTQHTGPAHGGGMLGGGSHA